MGAMQRRKGATAERELARLLTDELGEAVTRNLRQVRDGGHDLDGLPFALEVKRCEQLSLPAWWRQACVQAQDTGKLPALAYRQSRQPWRFVVPMLFVADAGSQWYCDLEYTMTLQTAGFCCVLREQLCQPKRDV